MRLPLGCVLLLALAASASPAVRTAFLQSGVDEFKNIALEIINSEFQNVQVRAAARQQA
jgi:hypothetical protein